MIAFYGCQLDVPDGWFGGGIATCGRVRGLTIIEGPNIQELVGINAGYRAARHVAHVVHAALHCAQAHVLHGLRKAAQS
jgi:hypothetical protein